MLWSGVLQREKGAAQISGIRSNPFHPARTRFGHSDDPAPAADRAVDAAPLRDGPWHVPQNRAASCVRRCAVDRRRLWMVWGLQTRILRHAALLRELVQFRR